MLCVHARSGIGLRNALARHDAAGARVSRRGHADDRIAQLADAALNKRDGVEYFGREALLNYALAPFKVTDTVNHFDVIAKCEGGGVTGQAGALRLGIARALLEAGDYRAELKKSGYLTRDARAVERKKYGLKKARKRPQFSKR